MKGYYEMTEVEKGIVEIARSMMYEVEEHNMFSDNDEMWNAAMSAGNKMVTIGLPFSRFKSVGDLNTKEQRAVKMFLESRNK